MDRRSGADRSRVLVAATQLAAFLLLLLQFIGESNTEQRAILMEKEKHKIPFPFCFIRYRPSKPYFLHALKWSVLQYSFLRPAISIAGIITDYYGVLCPSGYSIYYAEVYLDAIDFVSISIALYGLIVFGALCRKQMTGQQPLAKFLSIKGIVMLTFYQGFVFDVLQDYGVIKATDYWTATNVSDGLQALCTCVEMVIFSVIFIWAFPWKQYKALRPVSGGRHTSFWRATFNSLNYADFVLEAWAGLVFLCNFIRRKPGTRASQTTGMNIEAAFSGEGDWKLDNGPEQISSPNMSRSSGVQAHGRGDGAYYGGGYAGEQAYPMEERGEYGEQQQQQQQQQQEYGGYHHERSVDGYGAEQGQQQGYGHEQGQQGYGHNQGQPGYGHNAYPSEDRDYYHR